MPRFAFLDIGSRIPDTPGGRLSLMTVQAHDSATPRPGRPDKTPAAIRAALLPEEKPLFEADYREAMIAATEAYDLTPVQKCLDSWYGAAWAAWRDPDAHRAAMADADRLLADAGLPALR